MNKTVKTIAGTLIAGALILPTLTGCAFVKPYNKPTFVTVGPSETAFVIPLQGKTSNQAQFQSEEFLRKSEVATKRIQVPHIWVQTGRFGGQGQWLDSVRVIKVDRTPITREWTNDSNSGTSSDAQGIQAESKDSIKFTVGISATAQIDADKASKFLYNYASGYTLAQVMDSQVRNKVETDIIQQMSNYTMDQIRGNKDGIIKAVNDDVIKYFSERGISITNLGYKGDFTYADPQVQQALSDVFNAQREQQAQQIKNQTMIQQAKAQAEANRVQQAVMQQTVELKQLQNQADAIKKWNGSMPNTLVQNGNGANGSILFNIPTSNK